MFRQREEESIIYSDKRVRITDKRISVGSSGYPTRYRMSDIVFVSKSMRPPKRITGIIVIILGIAVLATIPLWLPVIETNISSLSDIVFKSVIALGVIALAIGIWDVLTVKPAYTVMISTRNGGVEEALSSYNEAYIERIADVMKRACVEHGNVQER